MLMICLDLEGVLIPEIWVAFAEKTGLEALKLTTRDITDYDQLMQHRINILNQENLSYADIATTIATLKPLPGALNFLNQLRSEYQVTIISDTFYEFAKPLMAQLAWPTLFCHHLEINDQDKIQGYKLRQTDPKRQVIKALHQLQYPVLAIGDSYNDIPMLEEANAGILFRPNDKICQEYPQFPITRTYTGLMQAIKKLKI